MTQGSKRTGVWLVGALGSVSVCTVAGAQGLRQGVIGKTGLVTARREFEALGLADPADFLFGGWDVRKGCLRKEAIAFSEANGVMKPDLLEAAESALEETTGRIRPGITHGGGEGVRRLGPTSTERDDMPLPELVGHLRADLRAFREDNDLGTVVVVHLGSAEAWKEPLREFSGVDSLLTMMDQDRRDLFPASMLYAIAAMQERCPFVNFTSCIGSSLPAMDELARRSGVPHMGRDGKTGETLLKTVLAPMFAARNLKVHSWDGFNLLGNRDGEVLDSPENKKGKVIDKDDVLADILGNGGLHSRVRIDYVPSTGDWKTAWDHIHFEGFLGTRMKLQFTWEASDSALAAPLILDLVRMAEFAKRRGETGAMSHLACFFKAPYGFPEHSFPLQFDALIDYADRSRAKTRRQVVSRR